MAGTDRRQPARVYCQFQLVPGQKWCQRKAVVTLDGDPNKTYCAEHAPKEKTDG